MQSSIDSAVDEWREGGRRVDEAARNRHKRSLLTNRGTQLDGSDATLIRAVLKAYKNQLGGGHDDLREAISCILAKIRDV